MGSSSFVSPRCHRLTSYPMRDLGTFTKSEQAHVNYQLKLWTLENDDM